MGRVNFPANAVIISSDINPYHPSQLELRTQYSGDVTILDYGHPLWRGRTVVDTFDEEHDEEVDAWLSAMDGSANWALFPHKRTSIPNQRLLSAEVGEFPFSYTVNNPAGLKVGQFCNISMKTFRIVGLNGAVVTLMPNIKIQLGIMAPATVIPIRLITNSGRSYSSERNADWQEPWRFTWEEVVGVYMGDGRGFTSGFSRAFN